MIYDVANSFGHQWMIAPVLYTVLLNVGSGAVVCGSLSGFRG